MTPGTMLHKLFVEPLPHLPGRAALSFHFTGEEKEARWESQVSMAEGLISLCSLSLAWMALHAGWLTVETFRDAGGGWLPVYWDRSQQSRHTGEGACGQQCGQAASPPTEVPPAPSQQQAGSPGVPGAPVIGSLQMAGCLGIYYPSMPFRGGLAA